MFAVQIMLPYTYSLCYDFLLNISLKIVDESGNMQEVHHNLFSIASRRYV